MIHKFVMPKLGWTMETGKIVSWSKNEGDEVQKGEEILEIETDKVTIQVEAPETGVLIKILANEGEEIPVNNTVALISDPGTQISDDELKSFMETLKKEEAQAAAEAAASSSTTTTGTIERRQLTSGGKILASPKAKKLARDRNVDLARVRGTGPDGVIVFSDVENYLRSKPAGVEIERIPIDGRLTVTREEHAEGIRKVISHRMFTSLQTSAQLTLTTEVSMEGSANFREKINIGWVQKGLKKISYTDIIAFVVSDLLTKFPKFNASYDGEIVRYFKEVNVGIATATDRGLMVPVVWNADKLSLEKLSEKIKSLAQATRDNKVGMDDLSGGTFTVSNLGMFGIDAFTPIVNPPEIAILGVGRIVTKPVYEDGSFKPEKRMVLSISFDHQIIDGHEGAIFLQEVGKYLESSENLEVLYQKRSKGKSFAIVLRQPPHGTLFPVEGFRMSLALGTKVDPITIAINDGVYTFLKDADKSLYKMHVDFLRKNGLKILVDKKSLDERGLTAGDLIDGIEIKEHGEILAIMSSMDAVVPF
ncbi:MAG: 2-oxo acid dehydrogenase subunit E2 [Candidatus Hodarchaeota archaeon]